MCHGKKYQPDSTSYVRVREAPGPLGAQPALASTAYGDERGNQVAPETSNPRHRDQPPRPTLTRLRSMSTSSRPQNVRGLLTHTRLVHDRLRAYKWTMPTAQQRAYRVAHCSSQGTHPPLHLWPQARVSRSPQLDFDFSNIRD